MTSSNQQLLPKLERLLQEVGENIRLARLRRRHSAALIAERAGISRTTLAALERGNSGVSLGALVRVLLALSLETDLALVARDDILGRKLQDIGLTVKQRAPKLRRRGEPDANSGVPETGNTGGAA